MRALLLAGVLAFGCAGTVEAATITATYDFAATYASGPNPQITGSITLMFDPTTTGPIQVTNFMSSVLSTYVPVEAARFIPQEIAFGNSCSSSACGVENLSNQFYEAFDVDSLGNVTATRGLAYSANDEIYNSTTDTVTREIATSIPEPTTLALLGTGLLGAATIRKRRS